jgi:hypothetical protein
MYVAQLVSPWRDFPHADVWELAESTPHGFVEPSPTGRELAAVRLDIAGVPDRQGEQHDFRASRRLSHRSLEASSDSRPEPLPPLALARLAQQVLSARVCSDATPSATAALDP